MPSYNIEGIDQGLDKVSNKVKDSAEDVQSTVDDPSRNQQDLYADVLDFQNIFTQKELGQKVMLSAVKDNFTVDGVILNEIK